MSDDLTGSNDGDDNVSDNDEETIYADSVGSPRPSIDELAARTVDAVMGLLRRANRLAAGVLIVAGGVCLITFLMGLAALDGGARSAWIFFGGLGAGVAIGTVVLAMWRLAVVGRMANRLSDEVRALISGDRNSERTVVEAVQVTEASDDESVVQVSRQFFSMRDLVSGRSTTFPALSTALRAITGLPFSLIVATLIALTFVPIALIFLLILIF